MPRHSEEHVRQVLSKAEDLLQTGWCKYAMAQDREGQSVPPNNDHATIFSIIGAIRRAIEELPEGNYYPTELYMDIIRRFEKRCGYDVFFFNNNVANKPEDLTDILVELQIDSTKFYGPDSQKEFVTKQLPLLPAVAGTINAKKALKEIDGYKTRLAKWDLEN